MLSADLSLRNPYIEGVARRLAKAGHIASQPFFASEKDICEVNRVLFLRDGYRYNPQGPNCQKGV